MAQQFELPGFDAPEAPPLPLPARPGTGYNLFLALLPDATAAERITERAQRLRRVHSLPQPLHAPERLHVSLHAVAPEPDRTPLARAEAASRAAASVDFTPLEVVFDRSLTFRHDGHSSRPFVLTVDEPSRAALKLFHRRLKVALDRYKVPLRGAAFNPHMTLLYCDCDVEQHDIEPLHWTATSFALVLSYVGETRYELLGRWPAAA